MWCGNPQFRGSFLCLTAPWVEDNLIVKLCPSPLLGSGRSAPPRNPELDSGVNHRPHLTYFTWWPHVLTVFGAPTFLYFFYFSFFFSLYWSIIYVGPIQGYESPSYYSLVFLALDTSSGSALHSNKMRCESFTKITLYSTRKLHMFGITWLQKERRCGDE